MWTEVKCWIGNQDTKIEDIRKQRPEHIWLLMVRLLPTTDAMAEELSRHQPLQRGARKTATCKQVVTEMQAWWSKTHKGQHARLGKKIVELFYHAAIRAQPAAAKHLKDGVLPNGKSLISGAAHTDPSAIDRLARRVMELHQRYEEVNMRGRAKQAGASAQAAAASARDNAGERLLQQGARGCRGSVFAINDSDSDDDDGSTSEVGSSSKAGSSSKVLTITPVRNRNRITSTSATSSGGLSDVFSAFATKTAAEARLASSMGEVQQAKAAEYEKRAEAQTMKTDFMKKELEAKLARARSEDLKHKIQMALEQADMFAAFNPVMAQQLRAKAAELSTQWMAEQ
jgi:hypothetical protein